MESTGLALPPLSLFYRLVQAGIGLDGWKKAVFFFFFLPALWLLVGWIMFLRLVYCINIIQRCHSPFPCVLHECSCNHSTYTISNFFPSHCSCNPLPPSHPPSSSSSSSSSLDQGQCWGFVKRLRQTGEWSVCHAGLLLLLPRLYSSEAVT